MNKTYLVTGAAGFIGAAIAQALIDEGNIVVTIDNLSTGIKSSIPEGVIFIEGDCQNVKIIETLYNFKFEAIFHMAGQSSGEVSFDNPIYDIETNTLSTLHLLDYCNRTGCKNFIYASSMSVYGDSENLPVKESEECVPKSFYAVGKLASEHYMRIYANFGIKTTALRFFNVYGPGQNLNNLKQGMVSIFLSMALRDHKINVKGDGNRFRDFVYIDDVVNAVLKAINRGGSTFEVLNICSGQKVKVNEVVETILAHVSDVNDVNYSGLTPGDQVGIYGSPSKAKILLDWNSKVDFNHGIVKMIAWAKSCYDVYE